MAWGVLLFMARAWTQLTAAVLLLLSARVLTPTEVGIFSLASALTIVLTQWVGVGTYEYIIRERNDRDSVSTALWTNLGVAALMMVVGFALAALSPLAFHSATLPWVVASLAPLTLPAGIRSAMEALMVRDGKLKSLAASTLVVETLALGAGVYALYHGLGLWSLVVHKWTQIVSESIVYQIAARWRLRWGWNPRTARSMFDFGHGIFGDRFLNYFQTYGIDFVLGVFLNPAAVAVFRVGARLVTSVATIATEPMRQINWKRLSDAAHGGEVVARVAEDRIVWMAGILWGPLLGLAVVADLVVALVLGARWSGSVWVVRFSSVSVMIGVVSMMTESTMGALGKTRWLPLFRLVGLGVMFASLAALIRFGPVGAAASQVATAALLLVFNIVMQRRLAGLDPTQYAFRMLGLSANTVIMGGVIWATRSALIGHAPPIAVLALCGVVGAVSYGGGLILLNRQSFSDGLGRARRRMGLVGAG
jgi:O-antigen/teichoic acid export membrane protein